MSSRLHGMSLSERPVVAFLEAIRSPVPTPGGGSASALAGALGASLLAMVAGMTKHRAASEEDVDRLQAAGTRSAELSARLTTLIDRDSDAYDLVVGAYKLPKGSDADKTARAVRIQEALTAAIDAPLDVMRASAAAVDAAAVVAAFGNPNAASDVGVALELLSAAARGARLNVEINLDTITDAAYADRVRGEAAALAAACEGGAAAARKRLREST
jgi:methenyltetrahydrofolate cyclohydrolase